jgi:2-polyprenyl-3-methyl-5-hydroxy-6-metoxy-1,4-benzoquinol methylase
MTHPFDIFHKNYNNHVNSVLRITGYDTGHLTRAKLKKLQQLFPDLVSRNFNLLDFGCGIGNLYESVKKFFPKASYTGVDKSEESILQAKSRFSDNSNFHPLHSKSWKQIQYDLIFSAGVFHHIPHDQHKNILKELSARLKPDGKLVIWEHNPLNPFTKKIVRDCLFDRDAILIFPFLMKKALLEAQFSDIRIIYTTFFPKTLSYLNVLDPLLGWLPLGGQYVTIGKKLEA